VKLPDVINVGVKLDDVINVGVKLDDVINVGIQLDDVINVGDKLDRRVFSARKPVMPPKYIKVVLEKVIELNLLEGFVIEDGVKLDDSILVGDQLADRVIRDKTTKLADRTACEDCSADKADALNAAVLAGTNPYDEVCEHTILKGWPS